MSLFIRLASKFGFDIIILISSPKHVSDAYVKLTSQVTGIRVVSVSDMMRCRNKGEMCMYAHGAADTSVPKPHSCFCVLI